MRVVCATFDCLYRRPHCAANSASRPILCASFPSGRDALKYLKKATIINYITRIIQYNRYIFIDRNKPSLVTTGIDWLQELHAIGDVKLDELLALLVLQRLQVRTPRRRRRRVHSRRLEPLHARVEPLHTLCDALLCRWRLLCIHCSSSSRVAGVRVEVEAFRFVAI